MRIAVITTGFAAHEKDYGGAAAILNLIKQLSNYNDIELVVFSFYYPAGKPDYNIGNVKIFSFALKPEAGKLEKIRIWKRCETKFGDEFQKNRFDLIHSMWSGESGFIAAGLSRKFNVPMVTNVNGGELAGLPAIKFGYRLKFFQRYFVNKSFLQAKKIICGSDFIISKIKQYYNSDIAAKAIKLPFGIDIALFKPAPKKYDINSTMLINIANAVPVKSHFTLFKA
ncbi:MAG TPA: glycosyltransferase, partial [Ignavibacteria bacterium]